MLRNLLLPVLALKPSQCPFYFSSIFGLIITTLLIFLLSFPGLFWINPVLGQKKIWNISPGNFIWIFSTFCPIVKHSQLVITSTTSNATSAWSAFSRHRQVCFDHSSVSGNIICLLSSLPRNSRTCPKCQFPQAPPARTISSLGKAARRLMLDWQPHIYNKRDQSKGDTHPLRSHAIWRYNEVTGEAGWCCRF